VEEVYNDSCLRAVKPSVGTGVTILAPDLPLALIQRSAWNRYSRKFVGTEF
jgi:hypothetical protein